MSENIGISDCIGCALNYEFEVVHFVPHEGYEACANPPKIPRWISVSERLPDTKNPNDFTNPRYPLVLAHSKRLGVVWAEWDQWDGGHFQHCAMNIYDVTHWRPLPEPPESV